jgi:hypothetical protein
MANGLNHCHANGSAVELRSPRKTLIANVAANINNPPHHTTVKMMVVRDDSSAQRATNHVVMKMKIAAITTFSQSVGLVGRLISAVAQCTGQRISPR